MVLGVLILKHIRYMFSFNRGRESFLCQMQKMFTPDPTKKGITWVMVDSDGEEVGPVWGRQLGKGIKIRKP